MADALLARTRALRSTRLSALVLGRLVEQMVLGAAALVLAAALGPDDFAPVSVLFVVSSVAVTLSHYGIGIAALRCAPGSHVSIGAFTKMRLANASIAVIGAVVGVALGGTLGTIVAASGVVWWASSEAFVRKGA